MVYALIFLIFWLTNYVHPLSFKALHVNNSRDVLKSRLKNCLCALSLNGLPFKSRVTFLVPVNAERKERIHFHQRVRLTPSRQRTVTAKKSLSAIDEHR
jgi:hypothetical protein